MDRDNWVLTIMLLLVVLCEAAERWLN